MAKGLRRGRLGRASPEQPPRIAAVVLLVGAMLLTGTAGAYGFDRATRTNLLPGTRIAGVYVGGRSAADAEAELVRSLVRPLHDPIQLRAAGASTTVTPWDLGMRLDVRSVVLETLARQQSMSVADRMWRRIATDKTSIALGPYIDKGKLGRSLVEAAKKIDRPVRDAKLEVEDGKLRVIPDLVGRRVDLAAAPEQIARALHAKENRVDLPVQLTKPRHRASDFKKVILVRTGANMLYLYENGKVVRSYSVATGTGGYPTPRGQFYIEDKRKNPGWANPHQPWSLDMPEYIPPGPGNPLGTRALYLNVSGIRIHGTPHDDSIGSNASHGCIRMHIRESEELFELVDVGTPVLIVGG